jgi:surface antigen
VRGASSFRRLAFPAVLVVGALSGGCATAPLESAPRAADAPAEAQLAAIEPMPQLPAPSSLAVPEPEIDASAHRLQCVPFARSRSGINLRGDAWTWWAGAETRYHRGHIPAEGAVLVFKRKGRSRGHVAVVTHVLSAREIVVDHANWLRGGRIHLRERVRDVSPGNDWSTVQVWYTPGRKYGRAGYPTYGFIYPVAMSEPLDLRLGQRAAQTSP